MQHVAFAAILVCTVILSARGNDIFVQEGSIEPAVIRAAQSAGLVFEGYKIAESELHVLTFHAPHCSNPVYVTLLDVSFEEDALVQGSSDPGYVVRYRYADLAWDKPNGASLMLNRAGLAVLVTMGLTPYLPLRYVLRIDAPEECLAVKAVDWRLVWDRNYLSAVQKTVSEPE
jgi:hypothetical protein